jgi:hypothetical protein
VKQPFACILLCFASAWIGFFGCFAWFDDNEVFTIPMTDKTFQRVPPTLTFEAEPTERTVYTFTQPGKTEVFFIYENGSWHEVKKDAR